jgi:hypothetical protein
MRHLNTFLVGSFILSLVLCFIYHTLRDKSYFFNKGNLDLRSDRSLIAEFINNFGKNYESKLILQFEYR